MLTNKQKTACFISGLIEPLRADVRAQNLTNLSTAISLACIYEGKSLEIKRRPSEFKLMPFTKKIPMTTLHVPEGDEKGNTKFELPVRRFTLVELQKRGEQGLYFHCDERYSFNHACKCLF